MTMKRSLSAVRERLTEVTGVLRELAVAIDDCPTGADDLAAIDALRAHAAEVEGDLNETAAAAAAAVAAEDTSETARASRLLADAHERFSGAGRRVRFGLSSHDSLFEIERLGAKRGGPWRRWSEVILRQLEQVDDAIHRADAAFVGCWQEVVDQRRHSAAT